MLALLCALAHANPNPAAIEAIEAHWTATQTARTEGQLYALSLDFNPEQRMFAAVGTYSETVTCHRAVPPEQPYPGPTAVLITVAHTVAAREYRSEYLYDREGVLMLAHHSSAETGVWSAHWDGDTLLSMQHGDDPIAVAPHPPQAQQLHAFGVAAQQTCQQLHALGGSWRDVD